ncbi:MAG: sulfite exporter TauE/SafE family protein [Haloarculaceae archaeon]
MPGALSGIGSQPVGLGVFFAVGLLGGAHCLGMCGPLVTTYATRMRADATGSRTPGGGPQSGREERRASGPAPRLGLGEVRQHALFNAGRTVAYAAVGALAGGLGAVLYDAAAVVALADGVRATAGVLVGAFILATGAGYLRGGAGVGPGSLPGGGGAFERVSGALTARIDAWVAGPRIAALGAVHAVLPCPLLFPAYLYAFARGSPVAGALALGAVGLGTFPTLFALGTFWTEVSARTRGRVHRALGAVFLVLGLVALTHGLSLFGLPVPRVPLPVYRPLG